MSQVRYEGTRVIDGVLVNFVISGQAVGEVVNQANVGSGPTSLVRQANGHDSREIVGIIATALDDVVEALLTPQPPWEEVGQGLSTEGLPETLDEVKAVLDTDNTLEGYIDPARNLIVFPLQGNHKRAA